MTDTFVPVQTPAVTDSKLDGELVTVSGTPVIRERIQVAGAAAADIASVVNASPTTQYGLVVRIADVASDAVDAGNPVKVGGIAVAASGVSPVSVGDRVHAAFDTRGAQRVYLMGMDGTVAPNVNTGADSIGNGFMTGLAVQASEYIYNPNGTTWDRKQGKANLTVLASAARTTTQTQADQTSPNHRGIAVILDITAYTAGSLTVDIQGKDAASGKYVSLLASAAVVATGTTVYRVYPGLVAAANLVANDYLWRTWRIVVTVGDATSITYSVGAVLLV